MESLRSSLSCCWAEGLLSTTTTETLFPNSSPPTSSSNLPPPLRCVYSQIHHQPLQKLRHGYFSTPIMPRRFPCNALTHNSTQPKQDSYTVGDFMTKRDELFVVKPSTTVDEAVELLVTNRITGLPVVDDNGKLVGVVSDYDLLALDSISGTRPAERDLFPEAGSTWKTFKEIQKLLSKTSGKTVGEVMTASPFVVRVTTNLEDAARLLLETRYRRLPVVDESGTLVGLISRGNVVKAALQVKRMTEESFNKGEP